jgi:hypothetical protein
MDGKAKMRTNGRPQTEKPNVADSLGGLTHDVIELAELQAQLFALDVRETTQSTRTALIVAIMGACAALGSIPVALIALAQLLIEQLSWSAATSYGVAALVGLVISVVLLLTAWPRFRSGAVTMKRSREELSRNVAWVKSSLRKRASAAPPTDD